MPTIMKLSSKLSKSHAIALSLLLGLASCSSAVTVSQPDELGEETFAEGRLIVKVTPEIADDLARVAEREREPFSPESIPVEALRQASQRHGVISWRRLFSTPAGSDDSSGLGRTYLLLCKPGTDLLMAVQDFGSLSGAVEYAEPDYIAHTQKP